MAPRVMSGARAKVSINGKVVGIFANISYALAYDAQPAYILGRYSAAEIDYTAQELVQVSASGFRVVNSGAHALASVPALDKLLNHEYVTIEIVDRQENKAIAIIRNVRPTGYSTSISARQLEEITVNFVGTLVDDESTKNEEHATAVKDITG